MVLAIYGTQGLAREVYIIAKKINSIENRWDTICFIDDINDIKKIESNRVYKFEEIEEKYKKSDLEVAIAVGEPRIREKLYNKVIYSGMKAATLVHPGVYIDSTTSLGEGVIICEGCTITCNVVIGNNTYIQAHSVIGHDIKVGNHSVIGSNCQIGGADTIGDRVFMGFLSGTSDHISIGNDVIISAGAIVFRDLPEKVIAIGNPARIVKKNDEGTVFK